MNKLIIPLLVLFTSSFAVAGEINVNNSKSITYTKQHTEHWDKKPWARSVSNNSYRKFQTEAMKARYQGYLSKQTVNATFEATVSRKAVLSGAFGLVKAGAKLGLRAVPYVGTASLVYDAYQIVNPSLESAGYEYNKEQGEFIKGYPDALCLKDRAVNSCVGIDSSIIKAKNKGGQSAKDAEELMRILVEKDFQKHQK